MKNLITVLIILTFIISCQPKKSFQDTSSDAIESKRTEKALQEATRQVGHPAIKNFQEKKLLKLVYEARDNENLICYAYFGNVLEGKRGDFIGKCLGFGIPYSMQFSNPEKVEVYNEWSSSKYGKGGVYGTLPQAEPNGLFIPEGLSATWLFLLDKEGKPHPVYIEQEIIVSPFKLH